MWNSDPLCLSPQTSILSSSQSATTNVHSPSRLQRTSIPTDCITQYDPNMVYVLLPSSFPPRSSQLIIPTQTCPPPPHLSENPSQRHLTSHPHKKKNQKKKTPSPLQIPPNQETSPSHPPSSQPSVAPFQSTTSTFGSSPAHGRLSI